MSDCDDLSVGRVGRPLPDVIVKLRDWEEGGYTVKDPQGKDCRLLPSEDVKSTVRASMGD